MKAEYTGKKKPLLNVTIGQQLDAVADKTPDALAIVVSHQDVRWSYGAFRSEVDRLSKGFLKVGIGPGDRVGIWSPNCIEWVLTQFATAKIGAVMVCLNPAYRLFELEYALNKVACRAIVTTESFKTSHYLDMLRQLAPELKNSEPGQLCSKRLPHLSTIITMGEAASPGMFRFNDVMAMGAGLPAERLAAVCASLAPDDVVNIQFTSGTTGVPKGAMLSHRNILNNAYFAGLSMRLTQEDRLCIPVPLYHCFGMVLGTLCCVAHGAAMVLPAEAFDAQAALKAVEVERCTALHGVPTMFIAELESPDFRSFDLSSLRTGIIAGSTCPVDLMNRLIDDMELTEIVIAYGQTECSPVNAMTAIDDSFERRVSTVGRAHFNWEQRILRANGNIADVGEQGEICSRGYGVMQGYWGDEKQTQDTIDSEGFLHSGDLGEMDADGYVKVTGRIKDMIIRGGENVYPREIEEFLYTHPDISEVQVFGVPDEKYGEQVCAWVQLRPGSALTPDDIRAFCQGQITHFKIPKYVKIVDDYPMTVTGKMQKFIMRQSMTQELGLASSD